MFVDIFFKFFFEKIIILYSSYYFYTLLRAMEIRIIDNIHVSTNTQHKHTIHKTSYFFIILDSSFTLT